MIPARDGPCRFARNSEPGVGVNPWFRSKFPTPRSTSAMEERRLLLLLAGNSTSPTELDGPLPAPLQTDMLSLSKESVKSGPPQPDCNKVKGCLRIVHLILPDDLICR
jgi:hypothetical protein